MNIFNKIRNYFLSNDIKELKNDIKDLKSEVKELKSIIEEDEEISVEDLSINVDRARELMMNRFQRLEERSKGKKVNREDLDEESKKIFDIIKLVENEDYKTTNIDMKNLLNQENESNDE